MSSSAMVTAVRVRELGKCYQIYARPQDRLKQYIIPRLQRVAKASASAYYREFWALKDVSFEIHRGETVGIIGRNGSGKSTMLQIICGTLSPSIGSVETTGRVAALLELGAGFNLEFTGRENILLNAAILGLTKDEVEEKFQDIVEFSELEDFIEQPVKTYSSGMYVRLAFSIAIHVSPQILIIDEALAVGDARFQAKCMKRIKEIRDAGATILIVSHDIGSVRSLCDRAIWIDKGSVRMAGDVFSVSGHYMSFLFQDEGVETKKEREDVDTRPLTQWGSHVGTIQSAGVYDLLGNRKDVILWSEELEVRIVFRADPRIDRSHLSAAFSIKDLRGTDLIVSATHDGEYQETRFDPVSNTYEVAFRFRNPLVTGKYLLVAAIEDRSSPTIHYYEYLEGAHYFASLAKENFFGIFQPEIRKAVVGTR